ncbi:MAG: AAA family ATPase [Candidatus Peribacteraceae bacterium]
MSTQATCKAKAKKKGIKDSDSLTLCQMKALELLEGSDNIFLTGEAGTGKSYLLNTYLKGKGAEQYPIVASTGAAAILVGGRTFHSFFGLGILQGGRESTIQRALRNKKLISRLTAAECVIIDEVSMLSGTVLETAEQIAQEARYSDEPWGGLRIIAVGDFAQLPPVDEGVSGKEWAFLHDIWHRSQFTPVLLKTVVRTKDREYLNLLQLIRKGEVYGEVEEYLNAKILEDTDSFEGTRLYSHRVKVDTFNLKKLRELKGKLWDFETTYIGSKKNIELLKKKSPIPENLQLKKGALVMIRINDTSHSEQQMVYVNGSLGYIHTITDEVLEIDLFTGRRIKMHKVSFNMLNGDGATTAQAYNFPVNLAWASTIHKAQGATLDRVLVQLQNLWEPGQAYVALSRTRSGDDLFIESWSPRSIIVEPLVEEFYWNLDERI